MGASNDRAFGPKGLGKGSGSNEVPLPGYKPGEERLERVPPAGEGPSLAQWMPRRPGVCMCIES